jgi:hypothetical protein
MHFDPHFIAAMIGLIVSEFIPIVTKSRVGGIVHSIVLLLDKLYTAPGDTAGLAAQIADLQIEIEKLRAPQPQKPEGQQ